MAQAQVDVLIVDDDESIRTMLRRSLQRVGLIVTEARDGIHALECLQTIDCAVILLDLRMPRLDGHGFVEQFVASRKPNQHPIIFAVSASGDEELARARADVVHAIVRKPFDMNELAEIVALCVTMRWAMPLHRTRA
jgi:two-component system chemotaxis response regulator CheY